MIHIQKHSPPNKFVKFLQQNKNAHFDDMPRDVKQTLRNSLLKEQGYLCAYCMSRIIDDEKNTKIEHYEPRNNENELDYKNLLAVCKGNSAGNDEKHQHCDTKKGNKTLEIDPKNKYHISQISYKPNGTIYSRNEKINYDLNITLNLNDDEGYLKNNRKEALNALKKEIKLKYTDKTATLDFLRKVLNLYTNLDENGQLKPYCGIIIEFLEKKLNEWEK